MLLSDYRFEINTPVKAIQTIGGPAFAQDAFNYEDYAEDLRAIKRLN